MLGGEVVELTGRPGSHKTRTCVKMAAAQVARNNHVLYLDTAAAVTPQLVLQCLQEASSEVVIRGSLLHMQSVKIISSLR